MPSTSGEISDAASCSREPSADMSPAAAAAVVERALARVDLVVAQGAASCVLHPGILAMEGMTSVRTRLFYNLLLASFKPHPVGYLEVGCWKGSSLVSALYGNNHVAATVIDDWSEFHGPAEEFKANVARFLPGARLRLTEDDCFSVCDVPAGSIHVYLYDGDHSIESHQKAITHFFPALADVSIVVIDDWNWPHVRQGTMAAFSQLAPGTVAYSREVFSAHNGDRHGYWNGMAVFVIDKTAAVKDET